MNEDYVRGGVSGVDEERAKEECIQSGSDIGPVDEEKKRKRKNSVTTLMSGLNDLQPPRTDLGRFATVGDIIIATLWDGTEQLGILTEVLAHVLYCIGSRRSGSLKLYCTVLHCIVLYWLEKEWGFQAVLVRKRVLTYT